MAQDSGITLVLERKVADGQAIVGFPKFGTIGIGFAVEEDWNTNLPYTSDAVEIYEHIKQNRGNKTITRKGLPRRHRDDPGSGPRGHVEGWRQVGNLTAVAKAPLALLLGGAAPVWVLLWALILGGAWLLSWPLVWRKGRKA